MPFLRKKKEVVIGSPDDTAAQNDTASIAPSQAETLVDGDYTERFTATGRPMPAYKPSAWANMSGGFVANAPQHMPHKFTDDSIMPVPVMLKAVDGAPQKRTSSFVNALKGLGTSKDDRPMKVVRMPRREYLRYFARDSNHQYIGTEPEREWTAEELQEKFGQYQDLPPADWEVHVPSGLGGYGIS